MSGYLQLSDDRRGGVGFIDPVTATFVAQGVSLGVSWLFGRQAGQQKRSATAVVEEAARLLNDNLDLFENGEITRDEALTNFDLVWGQVVNNCGPLGAAGQRCISERQAGSSAQCYILGQQGSCDFFARFRDPIVNAPAAASGVVADVEGGGSWAGSSAPSASAGGLVLPAALILGGLLIGGGL